ncbi:MAG: phosphopyruvate hydratase [archaeon]
MKLKKLVAREIKDSRGNPTIEVSVNKKYSASCPSGASTGKNEVAAFPVGGAPVAVDFLNKFDGFNGMNFEKFEDLSQVESILPNVGGNSVVALQVAILRAMSDNKVWQFLNPRAVYLPIPLTNCVGGGAHTKFSASDFQEFLLLPRAKVLHDAVFANNYIYNYVGKKIGTKLKTDEGAWAPYLDAGSILQILRDASDFAYDEIGVKVDLGLDVAASQMWQGVVYNYKFYSKNTKVRKLSRTEHIGFLSDLIKEFNLRYVEDPVHEDDFEGFKSFLIHDKLFVCGDDLVCTNIERLRKAAGKISAVIVKPNQVGSLVKAKEVVDFAKANDITPVISHRSGETMDMWLSHLAVGWQIPIIKCSIFGKERVVKLKELKNIQGQLK